MAYIKMKDIDDFTYFRNRISFQMRALGIHSTKALSENYAKPDFSSEQIQWEISIS